MKSKEDVKQELDNARIYLGKLQSKPDVPDSVVANAKGYVEGLKYALDGER